MMPNSGSAGAGPAGCCDRRAFWGRETREIVGRHGRAALASGGLRGKPPRSTQARRRRVRGGWVPLRASAELGERWAMPASARSHQRRSSRPAAARRIAPGQPSRFVLSPRATARRARGLCSRLRLSTMTRLTNPSTPRAWSSLRRVLRGWPFCKATPRGVGRAPLSRPAHGRVSDASASHECVASRHPRHRATVYGSGRGSQQPSSDGLMASRRGRGPEVGASRRGDAHGWKQRHPSSRLTLKECTVYRWPRRAGDRRPRSAQPNAADRRAPRCCCT